MTQEPRQKPFFARLLEQQGPEPKDSAPRQTLKYPSDSDEAQTQKFPSDGDDFGA